ncbi:MULTISPECIES: F0F1 ATP synthase subunit B [unclassified Polaribacter]|jgi:F-type H+-transporting ATPase subunit b|uniref:F0F1 ATP synthase subunit B n=1 Tax=unclassified Polaribacter TaxID=196858 RepID=UPI001C4F81BC|nr:MULTISPECIES: F0F1 ATP synthase subunit B [unclassified Polaribacter]QXP63628.1 F0F1 ATP synthase subunit B [Polaribacter sp. HaHaR_3_91]QXP66135.1 F0F1 ATP synthase subunit B [Polaribacter sp. AHE13PA]QXP71622.1 F0F1 ATP synthase subunit B [Polaribacter sp. R2A056_3_33]
METLLNDFSPGLFAMQVVILIILLILMKKFAWKPILNSLEERETGIEDALEAAENARKEMQNLQADNEKLVKEARAEREAMMKEARDIRDNMIAEAKEDAKEVTTSLIEKAQASIQQEKQAALAEIKKNVAELSIGIAESVIKKELSNKKDQLELVEGLLKDVTLN